MKTYIQKKWESVNKFLLGETKQNEVFSSKFFSKQSVKIRWCVFFSASCRLCKAQKCFGTLLRKRFAHKSCVQRACNASWLISYSDVLLAFTAFLRFLTDLRCCEPLSEGAKTEIRNNCEKLV